MRKGRTVLQAKRYGTSTCTAHTPLSTVARRMDNDDISSIVVVDDQGYLVGIITRTDLLRAMVDGEEWGTHSVADYMSERVITVAPTTLIMDVAELLLKHHIHRAVVVEEQDGKHRPLAVVSASDLVYHMVKDIQ